MARASRDGLMPPNAAVLQPTEAMAHGFIGFFGDLCLGMSRLGSKWLITRGFPTNSDEITIDIN